MNRIAFALSACIALLSLPFAAAASAQPSLLLGTFGGTLSTPVLVDDWAYVPAGTTVTAWNVAQPGGPVRHGDTRDSAIGGVITGLVRRGDYLYASWQGYRTESAGVAVYSIADRAQPVLLASDDGYTSEEFRSLRAIAVANDRLYLFDAESGVHVGQLDDPVHPTFALGHAGYYAASSATVVGDRIYTQGRNFIDGTAVNVWDIGNPDAPAHIGGAVLDGYNNFHMQFAGPLAVGFGLSVTTYDMSDPSSITELGTVESPAAFRGVLHGNYAYGVGLDGLDAWNLSNPATPTPVGHFEIDTFGAHAAAVRGSDVLLLTRADRFTILDASSPQAPQARGEATLPGGVEARDLAVLGDKSLVVQSTYGLGTVDTASLAPLARFEADLPRSLQARAFEQLAVGGNLAYLTSWGSGVFVLDITDPLAIRETARIDMPFATAIDVQGNFAYVGTSTNGGILSVIDMAKPAAPVVRGTLQTSKILRLAVRGNHVYIADEQVFDVGGLRIVDVTNPDMPVQVARYAGCDSAFDLALDDDSDTVYVACDSGMHVVDVGTPGSPLGLGIFPRAAYSMSGIALRGKRVYLGSTDPVGIAEIDVSNPATPVLVADHAMATNPGRIRVLPDGRVVAFGGEAGISVFADDAIFAHGFD